MQNIRRLQVALVVTGLFCAACRSNYPPILQDPRLPLITPPDRLDLGGPAWSPDGNKLVVSGGNVGAESAPTGQVYVLDILTGELQLVTETDYGFRGAATWLPDGREIAFAASLDAEGIWIANADGSGEPRFFCDGNEVAWLPDGQRAAIADAGGVEGKEEWAGSIRILNLNTGDAQTVFSLTGERVYSGGLSWSPDGHRLAFSISVGGVAKPYDANIYIMDVATGDIVPLTHGGLNITPTWSPDGSLIAYAGGPEIGNKQLIIARADGSCSVPVAEIPDVSTVAWSPDGSRMALELHLYGGVYLMDVKAVLGEDFLTRGPVCPQ